MVDMRTLSSTFIMMEDVPSILDGVFNFLELPLIVFLNFGVSCR